MLRANFLLGRTPIPNMDRINVNCVVVVFIEIIRRTVIRTFRLNSLCLNDLEVGFIFRGRPCFSTFLHSHRGLPRPGKFVFTAVQKPLRHWDLHKMFGILHIFSNACFKTIFSPFSWLISFIDFFFLLEVQLAITQHWFAEKARNHHKNNRVTWP